MRRTPKDSLESARRVNRRALMLGGAQAAFVAVLALRMRYMQVEQADQFKLLADENSIKIRLLPPARGLILDRNGMVVAGNEQDFRVTVTREDADNVDELMARLAALIPLTREDMTKSLSEIAKRSPALPITVAERLSWEAFSRVSVNAPALPGVTTEVGLSRVYPRGADFAHVLGYVGPVSDYDLSKLTDPDPLLQIPRFQIGKLGVEAKLEESLRGKAGTKRIEVNSTGRVMREIDRQGGQAGANVQLTIDAGLQNYVQARLGEESAACVVMNVQNGDILAIASAPSFDPNLFVRGITTAEYKALTDHDHRPLADKSVQGAYPPGSTFKLVTLLAALEAKTLAPDDTVYCPGHYELGDRKFHCWKRSGHGRVSVTGSLEHSCDVFFYDVAQRTGIEKIADMARRLGVGTKFDLPMSAVSEGLAPDKGWKVKKYGRDWMIGDTLNAGIGQGFVLASPLQLAVMTARVATGMNVQPRLVQSVGGQDAPLPPPETLGLSEGYLRLVRQGMHDVSNSQHGTAYASRIVADGMQMAGKTGTSQVRNISAAERASGVVKNEQLPWKRRDHALFVCFAPVEAPRYAVSLIVEHGGGGSAAAAPIARDVILQALYNGLPPLEAYPANQRDKIAEQRKTLPLAVPPTGETGIKDRA